MNDVLLTITIQIGNTDNRLSQQEWDSFCNSIYRSIVHYTNNLDNPIQFSAPSVGWANWQNAAWVFLCENSRSGSLRKIITETRKNYKQDSVAWTEGKTSFI